MPHLTMLRVAVLLLACVSLALAQKKPITLEAMEETARLAPPGTARLEAGFEMHGRSHPSEYNVPCALDYTANRRMEFRLEPILYTHHALAYGTAAKGLGDLEFSATVLTSPESRRAPGVAVAAEVKLPTARSRVLGSGKIDYIALQNLVNERVKLEGAVA